MCVFVYVELGVCVYKFFVYTDVFGCVCVSSDFVMFVNTFFLVRFGDEVLRVGEERY